MKGRIIIAAIAAFAVVIGLALWRTKEPAVVSSPDEVSAKGSPTSLPGFNSRRKDEVRTYSPEELKGQESALSGDPVVLEEGQRFEDLTPEEVARIQVQQQEIAAKISREKEEEFEVKLADLAKGLGLNEEQERALRAHYLEVQNAIAAGDLQAYGTLEKLLRGDGLEEVLKEVLTEEQWATHQSTDERLREERAAEVAAQEMNHLSSLLSLDKEQGVRVQEILRQTALQAEEQSGGSEADSAEQIRQGQELMAKLREAGPNANPLEALIQNRLETERERVLRELSVVLSEEQLERYRQSLIARDNDMSRFQNSLNALGKKGGGQ